ncbi:diguanylate cyclase [Pseudanabaena sp. FACHB-1998]|uniref:sensor domain-containing diguanylate cyclase n=1 Tax=Pseudanabaena sp. FACHB-1998 TaxID=2692858 RepID=UPI0016805F84|nr:diguanylate cyclase [Pseudanabaena sp. FACHB-1998]MBD2177456.1 diguanylate cyclase [Pseudanabaena sp. FACHB-1998]
MLGNWILQKGAFRFLILNLLVAIAYAYGVQFSHEFATLRGTVASVWFPSGMTLALVFLLGKRVFLGIICGSIWAISRSLFETTTSLSIPNYVLLNVACALGNTLQPLIATWLIKKFAPHPNIFSHVQTIVVYIIAAIVSPTVSATFGITSLGLSGLISWNSYGISWTTWWLASALAHLIFTPTLLLWKNFKPFHRQSNILEISLISILFAIVSFASFGFRYRLEYLFLPILIWIVFRYGSFFASLFVSLVSLIAIYASGQGYGFYNSVSPNESLLLLQSFMGVFSLTSLILSAVIDERSTARLSLSQAMENLEAQVMERTLELRQSEAQINGFFSAAPIGMGIIDSDLRYIRVNQVLAKFNNKPIKAHIGQTIHDILPDISPLIKVFFQQVLSTGKPVLNKENTSNAYSPNGIEQTWLASFFPIFDIHGIPFLVGFVVIDITDRKKAEADLQYAESILRKANLELEKLVNIDGLTQVANRRCFDERIELEWDRLHREQRPLSLLLFDIDYFKRYNDYYGHQAGDDCLTQIAQNIKKTLCRPADLIARYGGEEFAVILPNTDLQGAITVAEQIRMAVKKLSIPHQNSDISDIVTISLGVASLFPSILEAPSLLIKQADVALYRAKQQGRDSFFVFSP